MSSQQITKNVDWQIQPTTAPLPPQVKELPLIGSSLSLTKNAVSHIVSLYHEYGHAFRMQMGFVKYTVLAGHEANRFLSGDANNTVGSEKLFWQFGQDMGSDVLITALDGDPHRHMRRVLRSGYSRTSIANALPEVVSIVNNAIHPLQVGQSLPVQEFCQRFVTNQLGIIAMNTPSEQYFHDIRVALQTLMNVHVLKVWHPIMLKRPRHRQAFGNLKKFSQEVKQFHLDNPLSEGKRKSDLLDDILASKRPDGEEFNDGDLLMLILGSFFAGMDTVANTIGFFIYALAKNPTVLERITEELDEKLPDVTDYNAYRSLEVLHATVLEVLRMYPVAPFTPRTALTEFEFGGYRVPVGTEVMFAQTVTHFLPEYFPEPHSFNIDRFVNNKPQPHTFAPYTLGAHTCLGAGLAEVQMMVNIATLLKQVRFELETPDYEVPIVTFPTPNPGNKFKVRITEKHSL